VGADELRLVGDRRGDARLAPALPIRLSTLARSWNVWIAMGQYFASNFTFFFCLTWLFPYLQRTYHLTATQAGLLSAFPLVSGAVGNWLGGWAVDALYRRRQWRTSRRAPAIVGFLLAAAGLLGSLAAADVPMKVAALSIAIFGADMTLPPSWAFCIDIGQRHAGAVSGTMNMAGNLGSFFTSLAFPYLMRWTGSASPFFVVGATLNVGAAILWTQVRPDQPVTAGPAEGGR
jgi:ACS family glucarate transporter-like MFS transporter